jgi:hypothetical protein
MNNALGIIASILYLLAATRLGMLIFVSEDAPHQQAKIQALTMGAIALILNGILLSSPRFLKLMGTYQLAYRLDGFNNRDPQTCRKFSHHFLSIGRARTIIHFAISWSPHRRRNGRHGSESTYPALYPCLQPTYSCCFSGNASSISGISVKS